MEADAEIYSQAWGLALGVLLMKGKKGIVGALMFKVMMG